MTKDGAEKITTYFEGELAERFRALLESYPTPRPTKSALVAHLMEAGLDAQDKPRARRKAG